jgi:hypothetical protein
MQRQVVAAAVQPASIRKRPHPARRACSAIVFALSSGRKFFVHRAQRHVGRHGDAVFPSAPLRRRNPCQHYILAEKTGADIRPRV